MKLFLMACLLLKWVSGVWFFYNLIMKAQINMKTLKLVQTPN